MIFIVTIIDTVAKAISITVITVFATITIAPSGTFLITIAVCNINITPADTVPAITVYLQLFTCSKSSRKNSMLDGNEGIEKQSPMN